MGQYIFFLKMRNFADLVTLFNLWVVPPVTFASFIGNERAKSQGFVTTQKCPRLKKGAEFGNPKSQEGCMNGKIIGQPEGLQIWFECILVQMLKDAKVDQDWPPVLSDRED